ncbi:hypothetical protein AB0280_09900 [Pseudarthrobacter sp902506025]|uniref:CBU_0592 family membrane protein n=1 Tax=Pseudarthrobacter sp. 902506025 TaxID=3155291 RepID=UPI00344C9769
MELLWEVAGWAGAATILSAFLSVSMGWVKAGRAFQTANLVGACAFILNGAFHEAWPSVVTNAAWFLISAVSLLRMRRTRGTSAPDAPPVQLPGVPDTTGQLAVVDPARAACTAPAGHAAQPGAVAA